MLLSAYAAFRAEDNPQQPGDALGIADLTRGDKLRDLGQGVNRLGAGQHERCERR